MPTVLCLYFLLPPPLSHTLSQEIVHADHILSELAVAKIEVQFPAACTKRRQTRKNSNEGPGEANFGYQSFRRGDLVDWTGEKKPIDDAREVVYGCMVFEHRGQQRRVIITYSSKLDKFVVNCWNSWKRIPVTGDGVCAHVCIPPLNTPLYMSSLVLYLRRCGGGERHSSTES